MTLLNGKSWVLLFSWSGTAYWMWNRGGPISPTTRSFRCGPIILMVFKPDQDVVDIVAIAKATIVFALSALGGYVITHFIGKYW